MAMQFLKTGVMPVAAAPNEPEKPLKLRGSLSGSFSSPRLAIKILLGVSAKIPPVDPQMNPLSGNGCGQPVATSYGPVRSSPPFSWADAGADRRLRPITNP